MVYFYEGHMGGIYFSDKELSPEETYCDSCGDSDIYIGCAETKEQAIELLFNTYESEDIYLYRVKLTKDDKTYYFSPNANYNLFEDQITELPFLAMEYLNKEELIKEFTIFMKNCNVYKDESSLEEIKGYKCEIEEYIEQSRCISEDELTDVINSAFVPGYKKIQKKMIDISKSDYYAVNKISPKTMVENEFIKRGHSWICQKDLQIKGIDSLIYYCIIDEESKEHYHYIIDKIEYTELYEVPEEIANTINNFIYKELDNLKELEILK